MNALAEGGTEVAVAVVRWVSQSLKGALPLFEQSRALGILQEKGRLKDLARGILGSQAQTSEVDTLCAAAGQECTAELRRAREAQSSKRLPYRTILSDGGFRPRGAPTHAMRAGYYVTIASSQWHFPSWAWFTTSYATALELVLRHKMDNSGSRFGELSETTGTYTILISKEGDQETWGMIRRFEPGMKFH
jgi:hypothetical protein